MSAEIIDFAIKEKPPTAEFVRTDDDGRQMFCFLIHYGMNGSQWSCQMWAYDADDAQARLDGIKASGSVAGQIFSQH
jgi:hypothetical protein